MRVPIIGAKGYLELSEDCILHLAELAENAPISSTPTEVSYEGITYYVSHMLVFVGESQVRIAVNATAKLIRQRRKLDDQ